MTGERIRELRKKHRYSQKQLAEKIGVAQTAVSAWETGVRRIDLSTLERIASILGEPITAFFGNVGLEKRQGIPDTSMTPSERLEKVKAIEYLNKEMQEQLEAAALAADVALQRELEKVPDNYLLDRVIEAFELVNKIGKYELYQYAMRMINNDMDTARFTG